MEASLAQRHSSTVAVQHTAHGTRKLAPQVNTLDTRKHVLDLSHPLLHAGRELRHLPQPNYHGGQADSLSGT